MKKIITFTLALLALALTACAQTKSKDMDKTLIVYYSFTNNTKTIAERIEKATGYDIVRLETAVPYTGSYDDIVSQGNDEVKRKFKPELKPLGVDLKNYSRIIVGTPTWWYTMAPAVLSFLSNNNFSGKTVIPFMTNAGWPGTVIKDMKAACKGATFAHEKEIKFSAQTGKRSQMDTPEKEVVAWIESLK